MRTKKDFLEVKTSSYELLNCSLLNKGMGFSEEERDAFHLHGLIPPKISTIEVQEARSYAAFQSKTSNIEKYIYLSELQNSNETLFYYLITHHIEEMMPIIYTPVVGEGCIYFSHIYRRPRGLFLSYPNRHRIDEILANPYFDHVKVIVVSDGERILGLGDQGAGGMGIPIGKLSLYTACAGIPPEATLPILLDVGTDNPDRLKDPSYIGWKNERIRGENYDEFIDLFVTAIKKRFPKALVQWEDFAQGNANKILDHYKNELCTFNDDIQGTAAVTLATLLAAVNISGTSLKDQRIVIAGGGSAGCGISHLIKQAMIQEGLFEKEAKSRFYIMDRQGLLTEDMQGLLPFQKPFAQPATSSLKGLSLEKAIREVRPTVLIGVSGKPDIFKEEVIKEMAKHAARPIIFPLSNPTSKSEATPKDLMLWTNDKAILGTGSPFSPISKKGKIFRVDQTNNAYIFPGIGLGVTAVGATRVTENMFLSAARTLADLSPSKQDPEDNLLPPINQIRDVSYHIALAVAKEAIASELAPPCDNIEQVIKNAMWDPVYLPYKKV
ncbi:MAG: NAD-dependent malic enzyme [Chlamydiota bacterium]